MYRKKAVQIQKLYKKHYDVVNKYCTVQIFSAKISLPSEKKN